jgi:8-oxo-dGTP diphosphatase
MSLMKTVHNTHPEVIEAAGGIVWRETAAGIKVAIIHRNRYDDWSLPKGKRELGESWQDTALRETTEETGCPVKLGPFVGSTTYIVKKRPKVVLFWLMRRKNKDDCKFEPNHEVDHVKWVSPEKAAEILTYKDEREILRKAVFMIRD